jgi:hypothetical protein
MASHKALLEIPVDEKRFPQFKAVVDLRRF